MIPNRFAFVALAVACVAAAAGGGYLASRQNTVPAPVSAIAPDTAQPTARPVQETEAVVSQPIPSAAGAPASAVPAPAASAPAAASVAPRRPEAPAKTRAPEQTSARAQTPAVEHPGPINQAPPLPVQTAEPANQPARPEDRAPAEPARAPEPPQRSFEELVVSADSVIGLQMESTVTSERARVEDRVEARVVRDVRVGGQVAVSAGTRAIGSVMVVERGGRLRDRARLGIRFHTLVLADGTRIPMSTDTLYRYGDAPGNGSAAKIGGGAVAGAILGAILGGGKGAAIGATAGAGGGTAAAMASDRSAAIFPVGTEMTARIVSPVTVTIEK